MVKLTVLGLLGLVFALVGFLDAQVVDLGYTADHAQQVVEASSIQVAAPAWQFYFGVDGNTHQANFNRWSQAGYRIISLSVYGSPPNVQYAAVWVQRSGPAWRAIHAVDATTYQNWFNQNSAQGYVSTIVTVTGPRNGPIYAGVMEKVGTSSWSQSCDMTAADFVSRSETAYNNRQTLKSFREYGTPSDRRYCALWHAYPTTFEKWAWYYSQTPADYQNAVNSYMTNRYWRPAYVTVSEDQRITSLMQDTSVGNWQARHAMTGSALLAENQRHTANGLYMIHLQGGGSGSNTRYAAIWAQQDIPQAREWSVLGSATDFKSVTSAIAQVDGLVKAFMQSNGVRQAQIAIGKNGNLLMTRAYTWSEPVRHKTQTSDTFLLASVSKMFVAAAIQTLYNNGRLTPSTKVYPRLGYSSPSDARLNDITVDQLIHHQGGTDFRVFEAVFAMRDIAKAQNGGSRPASKKDIVDYMFKRRLDYTPGSNTIYSNYGYILLSYLVEVVAGQDYYSYLRTAVLTPGGPYDVRPWVTAGSAHSNDPITQESQFVGPNALTPLSDFQVAQTFGGDGMYKESAIGPSSLAASASTLVNFIHSHAVRFTGGRRVDQHDGSMEGSRTFAQSRADNVDWAFVTNTRQYPNGPNTAFNNLLNSIATFLNTDPTS